MSLVPAVSLAVVLSSVDPSLPVEVMRLTVPTALEGERVDRGLALLVGLSRAQATRLVAEGRARVSGATVRSGSRRLRSGDVLEVELPPDATSRNTMPPLPAEVLTGPPQPGEPQPGEPTPGEPVPGEPVPGEPRPGVPRPGVPVPGAGTNEIVPGFPEDAAPRATVVFVDADLVVVDKPSGLVVHPGAGNPRGTLVQQLIALFPDMADAGPEGDRPGIVHRLDKGTSGLLVVARSAAARDGLVRQMAARSTERRYLAVVHGEMEADEGVIEAPLGRSQFHRVKMAVVQGGRDARTHYWTKARSSAPLPATLVLCRLETGRTHQVRVHFAAIGHPVVADERYSKPTQLVLARHALPGLHRPWLHAAELGFVHPLTGEPMSFVSPLPADLAGALGSLGLSGDIQGKTADIHGNQA
jgi:23S rRNA pseudouridine1911/1915/1917 synthase